MAVAPHGARHMQKPGRSFAVGMAHCVGAQDQVLATRLLDLIRGELHRNGAWVSTGVQAKSLIGSFLPFSKVSVINRRAALPVVVVSFARERRAPSRWGLSW